MDEQRKVIDLAASSGDKGRPTIKKMVEIRRFTAAEMDKLKIIYPGMSNRQALNVFRELRTKILQKAEKKNFVVMVSAVGQAGGSSFITVNLGAVFALDQMKTSLLIDFNLYDPYLQNLLPVEPNYGLTDFLVDGTLRVEDIIYASGVPRLRVIPLGSHNESAAEFFGSQRMVEFVDSIKSRYDDRFIFLDTPPIVNSAESRIVAELSDYVVLVVPYGKVSQAQIMAAIDAVGPEKLIGLIFNN